jgi:hypothetical protein
LNKDDRKWSDLNLLQRSFLSNRHPWDKEMQPDMDDSRAINRLRTRNNDLNRLKKYEELHNINKLNHDSDDENYNINDVDDDNEEPICRICHGLRSEAPVKRLIRPCKCSGSQSYVHIECLNQWRYY